MTAQEFNTQLSAISGQMAILETKKEKLIQDQMAVIRQDLKNMGLTFGMEVDILNGFMKRHCTFNDVRSNGYFIYLEFTYPQEAGDGLRWQEVVNPITDFIIALPNVQFDYQKFMSNYQ